MTTTLPASQRAQRADARRNASALLEAAAELFVATGVEVPVRQIAARAGVTTATIYRHYPTRADLILAVYRHQVDGLTDPEPTAAEHADEPAEQLERWVDRFVDFLVTKRGLAAVLQSDDPCYDPLHAYFLDHVQPVFAELLDRTLGPSGDGDDADRAHATMRALAAICAADRGDIRYDARRLCRMLLTGLTATASRTRDPRTT